MSGREQSPAADEPRSTPLPRQEHGARRRGRDLLVFALLWLPYAWLVRRFWFVTDDAFISFRYAKYLAQGHGLRFNLGDEPPVEGYSNFLWVLVCAVFEFFRLNIELWPLLTSAACGTLLMWLVFDTLRRRMEVGLPAAAAATLLFALHPPVAVYSTSGLETMPFALLLFVAFERLVLRREGIAPVGAGLAVLGVALIRVEGVYWALALILLAAFARELAGQKVVRPLLVVVGILAVGYGLFLAWRYSYYGLLVSNTAYAKGGLSYKRLMRGVDYVVVQVLTQLTPLAILPAALFALRRRRLAIGLPIVALALAFYAYSILVSGDFMAMGRFLVPGWAFAALLVGWMLHDLGGRSAARQGLALTLGAGLVALGLLPAFDVHLVPHSVRARFHFRWNQPRANYGSEFSQWEFQKENALRWGVRGRAMKRWCRPGATFVSGGIGAVSYYSDLYIYDKNGLVTREVAMLPADDVTMRSPGHDKTVEPGWFMKHKPEIMRAGLLNGLPPVEPGMTEKDARGKFCAMVRAQAFALAQPGWDKEYIVDFRPIPPTEYGGPNQYLVLWTRIPQGVDPKQAWDELTQRLITYYEAGIDPNRDVMFDGYPPIPPQPRARRAAAVDDLSG